MKKIIFIILIILTLFLSSSCKSSQQFEDSIPIDLPPLRDDVFTPDEQGFIEIVFPESILGGWSAEKFLDEAISDPKYMDLITDIVVNEDGTVTMILTMENLLQYRSNMHLYGQLQHGGHNFPSIKKVIYETEMLTEITVWVDKDSYAQSGFERIASNIAVALYAGTFQVLSGVAPDDWHTTITVKDFRTGEVISDNYFPRDDMYKSY